MENHTLTNVENVSARMSDTIFSVKAIVLRGLPGSGKSTLSNWIVDTLALKGFTPFQINADFIRSGLNAHLGFSHEDRIRQAESLGHIARLALCNKCLPVVDFVMPTEETLHAFTKGFGTDNFMVVSMRPYHATDKDRYGDTSAIFEDDVSSSWYISDDNCLELFKYNFQRYPADFFVQHQSQN